jgi:dipeptidyl aminopeptidase/acylaminoacyl peptidase
MAAAADQGQAPTDIEASVAAMARIGTCHSPSFSPDGTRIAFVGDLTGSPQVWIVPVAGGFPVLVTALDEQVGTVAWSPDGAWIALSAAPGGGMNTQAYLVRPDGTDLRRLTAGGTETNNLGPWTHDGRALAIASNRRTGAAIDPYLVDVGSGEWRLVREASGLGSLATVSRDGRWAIDTRIPQRGDADLTLLDLENGGEVPLTPHAEPSFFFNARFSPEGRTIYLGSNDGRDLCAFARITLDGAGQPGTLEYLATRDDAELQAFVLSDDGATAVLLWNVAGRNELAFFDTASGTSADGPALPGEIATSLVISKDGQTLALAISGAAQPHDIWTLDRADGTFRQLTRSPHPGVVLDTLVRPELVRFAAHDGLELSGWLYRPHEASGPGAIVLSFHGGPEGQERPMFSANYQALLARGIAVLAPNVRGSSGFGKRYINLDNGILRHDAVHDILSCVEYVVAAGVADPRRIGIMGGSYGGYMTMAGLADYPDRFAAGVNLYGVVNFATFFANTEPWMAAISKVEYGDPDTEAEMLRDLSPIHRIDRVTAPTLVLHGANDTNVPVVEAEQVVEALQARGIRTEYILFPDEGHGFRKTTNRIRATTATVRWFDETLVRVTSNE